MIRFWLYRHIFPINSQIMFNNGFIRLSEVLWYHELYDFYNVEIGMDFLNKGYKI